MTHDTDHADAVAIVMAIHRILVRARSLDDARYEGLLDTAGNVTLDLCDALGLDAEAVAKEGNVKAAAMRLMQ